MTDYTDILYRLEKATGPDHFIDMLIIDTLRDPETGNVAWNGPMPTQSLDACIALCERVLPGWLPRIEKGGVDAYGNMRDPETWYAVIKNTDTSSMASVFMPCGHGKCRAIAFLLAIFRALQSQDQTNE